MSTTKSKNAMCGRFGRTTAAATIAELIDARISSRLDDTAHYNCPPGTFQPCVIRHPQSRLTTLGSAWWGFTPARVTSRSHCPINARSETAHDKPMFAEAFAQRPCLIPIDWWYEWQATDNGKMPHAIRPVDKAPFFLAGLWSQARSLPADDPAAGCITFTILTRQASPEIAFIHPRQPQALTLTGARQWLNPGLSPSSRRALLTDHGIDQYQSRPVDKRVGNPAFDDPAIMA